MKIEKTFNGKEVTIALNGCLDTFAAPQFANAITETEADSPTVIKLDFTKLDFLASSGLRIIVSAKKRADAVGRKIVIFGMNDVVANIFEMTCLDKVFEIQ